MLITEADRFEFENCFACFCHRLDLFLETSRGNDSSKFASGTNDHANAVRNRVPIDAGNKSARLRSFGSDADGLGLAGQAGAADIDIVVSVGKITASGIAQGDIIRAADITRERVVALRRVVATDRVTDERIGPRGGVVVASGIA